MASHAEGVQAVSITPALSLLHGHRSIVLLPIFHDPDGFGTSAESSGGRGRHGRLVYFTQHCPQSGCFLANRCHSSLQQCYGCAHRCAGMKNLRFLLYPERIVGRSTKPAATQNLFLYQLLLSDCGLFAIQRYENDGRTYCRLCCQKYTVCQRSYGRSGNGFPATNRNRHASTEQSMAELFGIPV